MAFRFFSAEDFFLNDPELQEKVPLHFLSHKELYEESVRKATVAFRKVRKMNEMGQDGVDNYS